MKKPSETERTRVDRDAVALHADRPITQQTQDVYRRSEFATYIAKQVAGVREGDSLVFALHGPWGSGKTSLLHLIEESLRAQQTAVIWFNPWLFSGPEQIASQFMRELGVQLGSSEQKMSRVGELIESYGKVLEVGGGVLSTMLKTFGPFGALAAAAAEKGLASTVGAALKTTENESVQSMRKRVEGALREEGRRIVVFVDDIDRLDADEVRMVFKMVRLVADFPNVSYVLAFDRRRVERVLDNDDTTGRSYLRKIVQASFDLPKLDPAIIGTLLGNDLTRGTAGRLHGPFHQADWPDIFVRVIRPLIHQPRDVRQYTNAAITAIDMLGEEVALEDVLALEAIRIFVPEAYDALPGHADLLAMSDVRLRGERKEAAERLNAFLELGGPEHRDVLQELCRLVFPFTQTVIGNYVYDRSSLREWRKERRVACGEALTVYLERAIRPGAASASIIRRLAEGFGDEAIVNETLAGLTPLQLESTITQLADRSAELAARPFENGLVAVLSNSDRLRRSPASVFDPGAEIAVTRLLRLVMRDATSEDRRAGALNEIYSRVSSFTWKAHVLRVVQEHKTRDDKPLVDGAVVKPLADKLRTDVLESTPERLLLEREPYLVTKMAYSESTDTFDQRLQGFLKHPGFFRAFLASLLSEYTKQKFGSVAVTVEPSLPWERLIKIAGSDVDLRTLLRNAIDAGPIPEEDERVATALALAEDVLSGRKEMVSPMKHVLEGTDE